MWRADGDRSPEDWLARQTGTSKADAGRLVATGRQLEALPGRRGGATRGELSAQQAEAIAGAAAATPGRSPACSIGPRAGRCGSCRTSAAAPEPTPRPTPTRQPGGPMPSGPVAPGPTLMGSPGTSTCPGPVAEMARVDNAIRHRADQTFRPGPGRRPAGTRRGLRLRCRRRAPHLQPATGGGAGGGGRQDHRPRRPLRPGPGPGRGGRDLRDRRDRARSRSARCGSGSTTPSSPSC